MRTLTVFLLTAASLSGAFRVGVGRADITPKEPIWLSGYAARTHASEGALHKLWAKALVIESGRAGRIVIVSTDGVGIPRTIADEVAVRVEKDFGIRRAQLLLNASHTHTGPYIWGNLKNLTVLPPDEPPKLVAYGHWFADEIVAAIDAAARDLAPAIIEYGAASAGFAVNRRQALPTGVRIGVNPEGPTDHAVPVLRITGQDGKLRAVLFGYACHNTTLTAEVYELSGDYAGFAAAAVESAYPGATAVFLMLCGADQNPNPRGTVELGRRWGAELADAVERTIGKPMHPLTGPIRTSFRLIPLQLAKRTREDFAAELKSTVPAEARRGRMMLDALTAGRRTDRVEYPIQAVRFGRALTILALGGEVVVDYDLKIQRQYPGEPLIVAGYSNDVMCYIPSARVLREGGYEASESMIYYAQQGPFAADVEDRIMNGVRRAMKEVGR